MTCRQKGGTFQHQQAPQRSQEIHLEVLYVLQSINSALLQIVGLRAFCWFSRVDNSVLWSIMELSQVADVHRTPFAHCAEYRTQPRKARFSCEGYLFSIEKPPASSIVFEHSSNASNAEKRGWLRV